MIDPKDRQIAKLEKKVKNLQSVVELVEKKAYKSKKLLAALAGCLSVYFLYDFSVIVAAYIIGQGLADFGKNKNA